MVLRDDRPRNPSIEALYPGARAVAGTEGGVYYFATEGEDALLITDSGTMLSLLSEEDAAPLAGMALSVRRFPTAAEREQFLAARHPFYFDRDR